MSLYAVPAALNADGYKSGHIYQYPENTDMLVFNMTARSDKYFNTPLTKDGIIPFGIKRLCQDYLRDHWNDTFFKRPKKEAVDEALLIMNGVLGKGAIKRDHWEALHDLGYLPVIVDAVPEGTLLPIKVPMLCFTPTVKGFAWVAGYLEDVFSNELWKATTIATIAFHYRRIAEKYAAETCDNNGHIPWQMHDFSLRGLSGMNDGAFNNIGHLACFKGTDSFPAVYTAYRVYGEGMEVSDIGNSVPATEHSVMTANIAVKGKEIFDLGYGDTDGQRYVAERETFHMLMAEKYPTGILSLVSDSYNYFRTIGTIAAELKQTIMERAGKLVFRPDSGNPFHIVCGYKAIHFDAAKKLVLARLQKNPKYFGTLTVEGAEVTLEKDAPNLPYLDEVVAKAGYELLVWHEDEGGCDTLNLKTKEQRYMTHEEIRGSLEVLWNIFGGTTNQKGYRLLDEHVGLIYGDSITMELADKIFARMKEMGFASSNIVFGVGSFTYQYITRDTFGFAVKATYLKAGDTTVMLCKEPVTDLGLKKSAKGCVVPVREADGTIVAVDQLTFERYEELVTTGQTLFETYFQNGECYCEDNLEIIRKRIDSHI